MSMPFLTLQDTTLNPVSYCFDRVHTVDEPNQTSIYVITKQTTLIKKSNIT